GRGRLAAPARGRRGQRLGRGAACSPPTARRRRQRPGRPAGPCATRPKSTRPRTWRARRPRPGRRTAACTWPTGSAPGGGGAAGAPWGRALGWELGRPLARGALLGALLRELAPLLAAPAGAWEAGLYGEWLGRLWRRHQTVRLATGAETLEGRVEGAALDGTL